jgi:hypothetical protein
MRRATSFLVVVLLFVSTGCYHAIIDTGRPASGTVINQPWASSFIFGLVPPPVVNTASQCPNGVSKVETQHSFLNGLVAAITLSIYTPITITVTCASGGTAAIDAQTLDVAADATFEQQSSALAVAADIAVATRAPVYVRF